MVQLQTVAVHSICNNSDALVDIKFIFQLNALTLDVEKAPNIRVSSSHGYGDNIYGVQGLNLAKISQML